MAEKRQLIFDDRVGFRCANCGWVKDCHVEAAYIRKDNEELTEVVREEWRKHKCEDYAH